MREIKFRVWDKEHKMFLPNEIYDIHNRTSFGSFGIMRKDWRNYSIGEYFYYNAQILEQYTGLKDKNGKEIYEGDIVEFTHPTKDYIVKSNIIYVEQSGRFHASGTTCDNLYDFITDIHGKNYSEVIGNIHENPELL